MTYSILANTVLVLVVPLFTTTDLETEKTGEMKIDSKTNPFESPVLQAVFNVLRSPGLRGPKISPILDGALAKFSTSYVHSSNHSLRESFLQSVRRALRVVLFIIKLTDQDYLAALTADYAAERLLRIPTQSHVQRGPLGRYITTLGLYVGFGTVLVGLFRYMPEDTSGVDATRLAHLSPAVGCTADSRILVADSAKDSPA